MNNEQALQIIQQALDIANGKGSFKLEESATILTALNTIKNTLEDSKKNEGLLNTISNLENERTINLNTIKRLKESVLELSKTPQVINNTTVIKATQEKEKIRTVLKDK